MLETLKLFIISKLGKLKHDIDMEAHSRDRLYWQEKRITGMKRDLEDLKTRVAVLEKPGKEEN